MPSAAAAAAAASGKHRFLFACATAAARSRSVMPMNHTNYAHTVRSMRTPDQYNIYACTRLGRSLPPPPTLLSRHPSHQCCCCCGCRNVVVGGQLCGQKINNNFVASSGDTQYHTTATQLHQKTSAGSRELCHRENRAPRTVCIVHLCRVIFGCDTGHITHTLVLLHTHTII